jgi:hypothetical protein
MILRAAVSQEYLWTTSHCPDWRRLLSINLVTQLGNTLVVDSTVSRVTNPLDWPIVLGLLAQNHIPMLLNERDPVLRVFWSRSLRDGRRTGALECACHKPARPVNQTLAQEKIGPEGADRKQSGGFFRFESWVREHQRNTR